MSIGEGRGTGSRRARRLTLAAMTIASSMILVDQTAEWILTANTAAIALLAALICAALVRRTDRVALGPVFGRRSRWQYANTGGGPGLTRHPPQASDPARSRSQPPG